MPQWQIEPLISPVKFRFFLLPNRSERGHPGQGDGERQERLQRRVRARRGGPPHHPGGVQRRGRRGHAILLQGLPDGRRGRGRHAQVQRRKDCQVCGYGERQVIA